MDNDFVVVVDFGLVCGLVDVNVVVVAAVNTAAAVVVGNIAGGVGDGSVVVVVVVVVVVKSMHVGPVNSAVHLHMLAFVFVSYTHVPPFLHVSLSSHLAPQCGGSHTQRCVSSAAMYSHGPLFEHASKQGRDVASVGRNIITLPANTRSLANLETYIQARFSAVVLCR